MLLTLLLFKQPWKTYLLYILTLPNIKAIPLKPNLQPFIRLYEYINERRAN